MKKEIIIFNEEMDEKTYTNEEYFNDLFNNEYENKKYVVFGIIGLWDGTRDAHYPKLLNSLKEAILCANKGFDGDITVSEGKYGRMIVDVSHHDGHNRLNIKEVTKIGIEMDNDYKEVIDIINRKGATKEVRFLKNYR